MTKAWLICVLLSPFALPAQQMSFDTYFRSNGLINNEVHSIAQDSRGFMYFGTPSGISVFDGNSFSSFDQSQGFIDNTVSSIQSFGKNRMILLPGGNRYYEIRSGRLYADTLPGGHPIKKLIRGKSGRWYACGYKGLYLFDGQRFASLPVDTGRRPPGINTVTEWGDSLLVVGRSYEFLDVYNRYTWKWVASSTQGVFVRDLLEDSEGNVWVATIGQGIQLLKRISDGGQLVFQPLPALLSALGKTEFRTIVEDGQKTIWIGGIENGVVRYDLVTGVCSQVTIKQGLISNTIFCLFCDRENNIWIGSNQGVQKLVHKNVFRYDAKQGLPADLVLDAITVQKNKVLTTGYAGIAAVNDSRGLARAWRSRDPDDYMLQLLRTGKGVYGLAIKKLFSLNTSGDQPLVQQQWELPARFFCMAAVNDNEIVLAGDTSLAIVKDGKIHSYYGDSIRFVRSITMAADDTIWTADLKNRITAYLINSTNNAHQLLRLGQYFLPLKDVQDELACIAAGSGHRIAIGSSRSGVRIAVTNRNGYAITDSIDVVQGLSNNSVNSLYWCNDSVLLAGTGEGLDKIVLGKGHIAVQSISQYYHFSNTVYSIHPSQGKAFWLGTEAGLISIPGIDIHPETERPVPVIIGAARLLNRADSTLVPDEHLVLSHNDNSFALFFSSPGFSSEKNIRYSYALSNGDTVNWSRPTSNGMVSFSNLPPGHYVFKVKAVNHFGSTEQPSSLDIVIRPAFWQTWWFYTLVALAFVLGVYALVRARIGNVRRQEELRAQMAESEMAALRAQMNPHFIFNCMNIVDGLITGDRKDEARDFLQKFSRITRMVLENAQYPLVSLEKDLQALQLYVEMEHVRYNQRFSFSFDIDPDLETGMIKIPPLLLQPFVENAIVHGLRHKEDSNGTLRISVRRTGDRLDLVVEDNGIGRARAARINETNSLRRQHLGMKVTSKRIDLLRNRFAGRIAFTISDAGTAPDPGTRVTLSMPADLGDTEENLDT